MELGVHLPLMQFGPDCQRIYLWPLDDEQQQLELIAHQVAPIIAAR
jgi:hypothetical protein